VRYHPSDEPEEWAGRGRPDWPTIGGTVYQTGGPVSHRSTGEQQRIRAEQAARDEQTARAELVRLREVDRRARRDLVMPRTEVVIEQDAVERFAMWLQICRDVLLILALAVFLWFSGSALLHGGWPIWVPSAG
jgi:hypothetical protein